METHQNITKTMNARSETGSPLAAAASARARLEQLDLAASCAASLLSADRQQTFLQRFTLHAPRLRAALIQVYPSQPAFDAWFESLCQSMASLLNERPTALWELDAQRSADSGWFQSQHMVAYSAYTDRFAGTLNGVATRIPYLKELGITYLHLLPFLRARIGENDGGFAVSSFDEIDPALGTMDDLERLTQQLRAEGISLCSDFVLNHVADDHPWAMAAKQGDTVHAARFHLVPDKSAVDAWSSHLGQVFPETAPGNFTWIPELASWTWTTFYPYQWDLNYANPDVFLEITRALLNLANRGIEVFRLDSAAFLWKRAGTNCMNQPECHLILQALRAIVDIVAPGVLLKAEAIVPVHQVPPYFGTGDAEGVECHLAYNSSLMTAGWVSLAEENGDMVRRVLQATPPIPSKCSWLNYVRCHDDIGWNVLRPELAHEPDGGQRRLGHAVDFFAGQAPGSYAQGQSFQAHDGMKIHGTNGMAAALTGWAGARSDSERALSASRLTLLYGLALSVGGIPLIYMGDEFGLGNDPRSALDWPLGADGRQLHRPVFPDTANGLPLPHTLVSDQIRTMLAARRSIDDFRADRPIRVQQTTCKGVVAFRRGRRTWVLANFSQRTQNLSQVIPEAFDHSQVMVDCLSGQSYGVNDQLLPLQIVWLRTPGVTVVGEALIDDFSTGPVIGGAPFNVARHLAGLAQPVHFISRVGSDLNGHLIRQEMERFGMATTGLQTDFNRPTGIVKVVEPRPGEHEFRIQPDQAYDHLDESAKSPWFTAADILYGGTLLLRSAANLQVWRECRQRHQGLTVVDFNWREGHVSLATAVQAIQRVDLLKVNQQELGMLLAWAGQESMWAARPPTAGEACIGVLGLVSRLGCKLLVVTYGAAGHATIYEDGVCKLRGSAPSLQNGLIDTVGAGDAFSAVLIAGLLRQWPMAQTLEQASRFATAVCTLRGAVPGDLDFYASWLQDEPEPVR